MSKHGQKIQGEKVAKGDTDNASASSGKSYYNGGVQGDSLSSWYDKSLASKFSGDDGKGSGGTKGSGGSEASASAKVVLPAFAAFDEDEAGFSTDDVMDLFTPMDGENDTADNSEEDASGDDLPHFDIL